jgi:hypothetical protein
MYTARLCIIVVVGGKSDDILRLLHVVVILPAGDVDLS